jgi:hypothetical protein
MRKKDWSATDLARNAGISPSTILRALNTPNYPYVFSLQTLQKIARGAGELLPIHLTDEVSDAMRHAAEERSRSTSRLYRQIEMRIVSTLPASSRSSMKVPDPEVVPAPFQLADDETAFAFRNPDEALGPWLKPRSLMFATKARDPVGGDIVMLTKRDGRTNVRLLIGIDESGLSLSRSMPAKVDEKVAFDDIGEIAVIVQVVTG